MAARPLPADDDAVDPTDSAPGTPDGPASSAAPEVPTTHEPASSEVGHATGGGPPRGEPGRDQVGDDVADLDAQWRDIVARLGDLSSDEHPHRRREDADGSTRADPRPQGPGSRTVRPAADAPRAWAPDPAVDEAEDHFEPPDPGPVLGGDPLLTMAWVAAVGVPGLLLLAVVLWPTVPTLVLQIAGVAFLVAVGVLIWRMPHRDDEDRGTGAVV